MDKKLRHHEKHEGALDRPLYRDSRWEKAVKVYTVNQESRFLLVQNVHSLGVTDELLVRLSVHGNVEEHRILGDYPCEPYTEVHWVKLSNIDDARIAKKKMDNISFYGKNLHVCYAPEYESVGDTREKLRQRRAVIARKARAQTSKSVRPSASLTQETPDSVSTLSMITPATSLPLPLTSPLPASPSTTPTNIPPLFPAHTSAHFQPLLPPPLAAPHLLPTQDPLLPLPPHPATPLCSLTQATPLSTSSRTPVSVPLTCTSSLVTTQSIFPQPASSHTVGVSSSSSSGSLDTMSTKGLNRNQRVEAYWSGDGATSDLHGGMAPSGRSTRGRGRKEGRDDVGRKKLTPQHSSLLHSAREDSSTSRKDLVRQPGCAVDASCQSVAMESHALSHLVSSPGPSCTLVASQSESCEMPPRPVFQADPVSGDVSMDKTISLARSKMRKVFGAGEDSSLAELKHKPKKRKRI